jgi:hypothetical protein
MLIELLAIIIKAINENFQSSSKGNFTISSFFSKVFLHYSKLSSSDISKELFQMLFHLGLNGWSQKTGDHSLPRSLRNTLFSSLPHGINIKPRLLVATRFHTFIFLLINVLQICSPKTLPIHLFKQCSL